MRNRLGHKRKWGEGGYPLLRLNLNCIDTNIGAIDPDGAEGPEGSLKALDEIYKMRTSTHISELLPVQPAVCAARRQTGVRPIHKFLLRFV